MQPFKVGERRPKELLAALAAGFMITVLSLSATLELGGQSREPRRCPCRTDAPKLARAFRVRPEMASPTSPQVPSPMSIVRQLCSAGYAGRKAGTPGADRAAAWLAAEFQRTGLQPSPGAPGFRQSFTMPVSLLASPWDRKARLRGPVGATTLIEYPCFRGGGFSAEAEAVFAGTGVARRDQGWDDYQGHNVRGKFVIYRDEVPAPGIDREEHARWRDAQARGALGCLVLSRRPDAAPAGLESPIRDFPVLRLDSRTAQRLFGRQSLGVSRQSFDRHRRTPASDPIGSHDLRLTPNDCLIRIDIPPSEDPARPAANIIGMIPGTDPAVAGEAVILSAHYDHLGATGDTRQTVDGSKDKGRLHRTAGGQVPPTLYPGADDDASGVAVVLGAARALRQAGVRPRRTILFCLWTAEECGLLGSQEYVDHPLLPLADTHFVLQVEMVGAGRSDTFLTSAAPLSGTGHAALSAAAADLGLTLAADTCKGVSDHMPFIRRRIPALVVTTTGDHPNYHTSRDTPDTLHPAGIDNATRLCTQTIWREANE